MTFLIIVVFVLAILVIISYYFIYQNAKSLVNLTKIMQEDIADRQKLE